MLEKKIKLFYFSVYIHIYIHKQKIKKKNDKCVTREFFHWL